MKSISDDTFEELLSSNSTFMVMFGASWCGPCRALKPQIEKLGREDVVYLDIENSTVPEKHSIRAVPTLIVFEGGQEKVRGHNLTDALLESLGGN